MRTIPFESIVVSIVVEQRKLIKQLQDRIIRLEEQLTAGTS